MKYAKREGPEPVEPVEIHGLRISIPHFGKRIGLEQNGRYLAAKDSATGEHLWLLRIYEVHYNPKKEEDVQDLFITEMGVRDGMVRVKEEMGRVYAVDVLNKLVELVYSPFDQEKKLIKQRAAKQNLQVEE